MDLLQGGVDCYRLLTPLRICTAHETAGCRDLMEALLPRPVLQVGGARRGGRARAVWRSMRSTDLAAAAAFHCVSTSGRCRAMGAIRTESVISSLNVCCPPNSPIPLTKLMHAVYAYTVRRRRTSRPQTGRPRPPHPDAAAPARVLVPARVRSAYSSFVFIPSLPRQAHSPRAGDGSSPFRQASPRQLTLCTPLCV
jgi:hypothetical protein